MWQCPNCGREMTLTEQDRDVMGATKFVLVECSCDAHLGLNIVIGLDQRCFDHTEIFSFDTKDMNNIKGAEVVKRYILTDTGKKEVIYCGKDTPIKVLVNEDGTIDIPVMLRKSKYTDTVPAELKITEVLFYGEDNFNQRYVAKQNRNASNTKYLLGVAKIKVVAGAKIITDGDIIKAGQEPMK